MQWGQIKTLFILCFFLLDIYLIFLVIQKQDNQDLAYKEKEDQQQEKMLEIENIKITKDLPEPLSDEALVGITPKLFTNEEISQIKELQNQEIEVVNNSFIIGSFKKGIAIPENATYADIAKLVTGAVYLGDEYVLEKWDRNRNVLIFFQKKNDRPVFYNQSGMIMVFLNDKDEMIAYIQSLLGEPETNNDKKSLITPFKAIYSLYENRLLLSGDEVTDVQIGYHTMIPLGNGKQVLVPTWKVTINDAEERFVNANYNTVITVAEDFMNNVLELSIDNALAIKENDTFKEHILALLNSKLKDNRSEEE